jgi:signal peptide peptidase SppA
LLFAQNFCILILTSFRSQKTTTNTIMIRFRRKKIPRVAVLRLDGVIEEGDEDSLPRRVSSALEDVEHVKAKALILRINSPGGTVGATQEIYDTLRKFRAEKKMPLVASMGDVAASGGVYVSMAAERVLANAGTVTGSIGVIIRSRNLSQLFSKVGVEAEVVKSGQFKDTPAYYRSLTEAERGMLQEMINDTYEQFVDAIMRGRNLSPAKVRQFADGRVMTAKPLPAASSTSWAVSTAPLKSPNNWRTSPSNRISSKSAASSRNSGSASPGGSSAASPCTKSARGWMGFRCI